MVRVYDILSMTTTGTIFSISTGLVRRLNLNVSHIYLSIKEEDWCPITLFTTPIIEISSLLYIHDCHFSSVIFDPLSTSFVHNCHIISLAVMVMITIRSVVKISFVKNYTNYTVFSSGLWVFDGFKPKLMINISIKENIIKKIISLINLI